MKFDIGDRVIVRHPGWVDQFGYGEPGWIDTGTVVNGESWRGIYIIQLDKEHYWTKMNGERVYYQSVTTDAPIGYRVELDVIDKVKKICSTELATTKCSLPEGYLTKVNTVLRLGRWWSKVRALWV